MSNWRDDIEESLAAFKTIADLARVPLGDRQLIVEYCEARHEQPRRLPSDMRAVYGFWGLEQWLKIGKAGPKSNARYTSQHYTGSAISTLSGSISRDSRMRNVPGLNPDAPGEWIKACTNRVNILIAVTAPSALPARATEPSV